MWSSAARSALASSSSLLARSSFAPTSAFACASTASASSSSSLRRAFSSSLSISAGAGTRSTPPPYLPKRATKSTFAWSDFDDALQADFPPSVLGTKTPRPIPAPKHPINDPQAFLRAAGWDLIKKVKADTTWEQLFTFKSPQWKAMGLAVKDRKYLAWCVEKYRVGFDPRVVSTVIRKPKKYRRHGPAVQGGIRMRWSKKFDVGTARRPWGMQAIVRQSAAA